MSNNTLQLTPEKITEIRGWIKQVRLSAILRKVGLARHQFESILNGRVIRELDHYTKAAEVINILKDQVKAKTDALEKINSL